MLETAQSAKIERLSNSVTDKDFGSVRFLAQYIGLNCRPEEYVAIKFIALGSNKITEHEKNQPIEVIRFLKHTGKDGLKYTPFDLLSLKVVLLTDAAFSNSDDLKTQLSFVIALVDHHKRWNIVQYGSTRWKNRQVYDLCWTSRFNNWF